MTKLGLALLAALTLTVIPVSPHHGSTLAVDSAQARVGRPLSPGSVAGVARRTNRRAYRHGAYGGFYVGPGGLAITPDYPRYGPVYGPGWHRRGW